MKNYILTENQLNWLVENIQTDVELSLRDALKIVVSVLKEKGYDDEQSVDFLLRLREKDPFHFMLAHDLNKTEIFKKALGKLSR